MRFSLRIAVLILFTTLISIDVSQAQHPGQNPPEVYHLFNCEMKVVWDSIKTKEIIDEEYVASNFLTHCMGAIRDFSRFADNNFLSFAIINNLAFANKKFAKEGAVPFKMYESFDYSGSIKREAK
jgi:hypothetical protein